MRLNLFVAKAGGTSRRKADALIQEGRVKVNGKVTLEPFLQVSEKDEVIFFEQKITIPEEHVYIIYNKPKGVTTTLQDRYAESTITDMLAVKLKKNIKGLYPVGRLDRDSRGLIIITNDGDFCYKLTHPKFEVEKEYQVSVNGQFNKEFIAKAKKGITDAGELLKVKDMKILRYQDGVTLLRAVICEGRKRHLRRLLNGLGFFVVDLKRVRIGKLVLGDLAEGEIQLIDKNKMYSFFNEASPNTSPKGVVRGGSRITPE